MLSRRVISSAGAAACISVVVLMKRGNVTAASGVLYWIRASVTSRSSSMTWRSSSSSAVSVFMHLPDRLQRRQHQPVQHRALGARMPVTV